MVTWLLDDVVVGQGATLALDPVARGLAVGPHPLVARVTDETAWVLADPSALLVAEHQWVVRVVDDPVAQPDGGVPVVDAGISPPGDDPGCGCHSSGETPGHGSGHALGGLFWGLLIVGLALRRRRRRRGASVDYSDGASKA